MLVTDALNKLLDMLNTLGEVAFVFNGEVIPLSKEAKAFIREKVLDGPLSPELHTLVCDTFYLPRFESAIDWKPYAIRQTLIEIYGDGRKLTYGGHYYCARCHAGLDIQPTSDVCPKCKRGRLNNVGEKSV